MLWIGHFIRCHLSLPIYSTFYTLRFSHCGSTQMGSGPLQEVEFLPRFQGSSPGHGQLLIDPLTICPCTQQEDLITQIRLGASKAPLPRCLARKMAGGLREEVKLQIGGAACAALETSKAETVTTVPHSSSSTKMLPWKHLFRYVLLWQQLCQAFTSFNINDMHRPCAIGHFSVVIIHHHVDW